MSGPLVWWANRKSRIGVSPAAITPPHVHGMPWWCAPPIAPPQPEHIEYVVEYQHTTQSQAQTVERDALLGRIATWLKAARRLLHEQVESQRGDLHTTDGLLVESWKTITHLIATCHRAGLLTVEERACVDAVHQALQARSARIRRERATNEVP